MKYKLLALFTAAVFIFAGCSNSESTSNVASSDNTVKTDVTNANLSEEKGTIKMTKQMFLEKVMNYEKNPQEWVFEGDKPCLIDFYADWCGPCKIAAPILEKLAVQYDGKINIYKIDTQVEQELAAAFGVRSIPMFLFCPKEGKPQVSNGIARTPEDTEKMFKQMIDEVLLKEI